MKVFVKGKGEVQLDKSNFIAQGGEGSVYANGGTAYKIYEDPAKMIPIDKIHELSALTHAHIIKPTDIICDSKNKAIGYTMKYVKNTYSLCQLFPKIFRQRNNITPQMTLDLVKCLQDIVKHVHDKRALIVDLNEMNFLCDSTFKEIYAIDVDSYQTPSYPATALMDSVRDRHSPNKFNEGTDWFSFGIVSFNMFIGIHPYKGKHPTLSTMDERMLKNVSALNKAVSLPGACLDFSVIPANYKDWYKAIFEEGKRIAPPSDNDIIHIVHQIKKIIGSNSFDIKELLEAESDINAFFTSFGVELVATDKGIFLNKSNIGLPLANNSVLAFTEKLNHPIRVEFNGDKVTVRDLQMNKDYDIVCSADQIATYQNRVYVKSGTKVLELNVIELPNRMLIPSFMVVGTIMENATSFFPGVAIQNMMDCYYASLFTKTKECRQVRIPDLNGYRIIDARFESNVLMVLGMRRGKYDKFIIRFSDDYTTYDVRIKKDINHNGFNFIVLDNGICAHINEEENFELFSSKKDSKSLKVIDDPIIKSNMKLTKVQGGVGFIADNKLYSIKTK